MCLCTVVTPSFNSEVFIEDTIKSVINQSFTDWEMIVVDDCSKDNSVDIIERICQEDPRIKLIRLNENLGAAAARNIAIKEAKGRYIAFLDSDDKWLPNKLDNQLKFMIDNSVLFSYSAYDKIDEYGKKIGSVGVPEKVSYYDLLKVCSIGCLTAIYDSERLGKVYMPEIRKRQDLGLWLRILKEVDFGYSKNDVLAEYRVHKNSISSNKKIAALYTWKLYRKIEGLNFFVSIYYFSFYAFNGFLRTKFPKIASFLGLLKEPIR